MKRIVAAIALLALIGYAWQLFRQMTELDQRVSAAEQSNRILEGTVNRVRAEAAQNLDALEAAEELERQAREESADEATRAAQAEQDRAAAQGAQQRALETIATAESAVEQAAAAAERQRRERREEWRRLGSALRKIAPTETGAAAHRVDLSGLHRNGGGFDAKSRETLSRLAGALLANYGYAARLHGPAGQAVRDYLVAAGVPADSLSLDEAKGINRLELSETVLAHP